MIYQTLQEATKARGARKIKIINLGLEPWEAIDMGLEVETVVEVKAKNGEQSRSLITCASATMMKIGWNGCRPTASN